MTTKLVAKSNIELIPFCGICGEVKKVLPELTNKKQLKVYVCANKMEGERMPCDGHAYRIFVKNATDSV